MEGRRCRQSPGKNFNLPLASLSGHILCRIFYIKCTAIYLILFIKRVIILVSSSKLLDCPSIDHRLLEHCSRTLIILTEWSNTLTDTPKYFSFLTNDNTNEWIILDNYVACEQNFSDWKKFREFSSWSLNRLVDCVESKHYPLPLMVTVPDALWCCRCWVARNSKVANTNMRPSGLHSLRLGLVAPSWPICSTSHDCSVWLLDFLENSCLTAQRLSSSFVTNVE